jgi:hypothetical protein
MRMETWQWVVVIGLGIFLVVALIIRSKQQQK